MAINISEQFNLNTPLPIDSRIVMPNYSSMDSIVYKYDGLKVFLTDERRTYTWNTNIDDWDISDINGSGDPNFVPAWSSPTGLTSSPIYIVPGTSNTIGKVGVNTQSPTSEFQVNSESGSSQPFIVYKGLGTIIGHNWYNDGSDQYFNNSVGSSLIKFMNNGDLVILNRTSMSSPIVSDDGSFLNVSTIFSSNSVNITKDTRFNVNNTGIVSSAMISATNSYSIPSKPDYTWLGNTNTGIYHPASNKIGVSANGSQRVLITTNGVLFGPNNSISNPSAMIHVDNISNYSYIKFTVGGITGTGVNDGFDVGVNASGNPIIKSNNSRNLLFSFKPNGNISHSFNSNEFNIYSDINGETETNVTNGNVSRVITGTKKILTTTPGIVDIIDINVPSSSYFFAEATFTSSGVSGPNKYFRTCIIMNAYSVNSSGVITLHNTGTVPSTSTVFDKYNSSSISSFIGLGLMDVSSVNTLKLRQGFSVGSGYSTVAFKIVLNASMG